MLLPADATDASSRLILFGTDERVPASAPLRAGPLTLVLRGGGLHDLTWQGRAAWQAVMFPYRDTDWWTPPFAVEDVAREARDGGFHLIVRGAFATDPRLRTRVTVEGDVRGRVRVEAEAVPDGDLSTNRTGLCLLLHTSAGGDAVEIEHDDGRVTRSTIPILVSPWPAFMGIRAVRRRLAPGCWAVAAFSGDSFEFEDQRNNADASFKIYSRSNMMPRPYVLRAGVPVRQALDLWFEREPRWRTRDATVPEPGRNGVAAAAGARRPPWKAAGGDATRSRPGGQDDARRGDLSDPSPHVLSSGKNGLRPALRQAGIRTSAAPSGRPPPRLGLAAPLGGDGGLLRHVTDALRPAYLQASLHADDLAEAGPSLAALAKAGVPLRMELTAGHDALSEPDLAPLRAVRPEAVSLFPGHRRHVQALRRAMPAAAIGGGTPHFFAQVNRVEELGPVDFLTFTVSPLVHGADDEEVMACRFSIPGQVATLARRWPGLAVHLGPSAIAMRTSPLGRMPPADGRTRRAMASDDPRARGLFGAAWALAVVAACAEAGVAGLTLMASEGPSGVVERKGAGFVWHPVSAVLARLGGVTEVVPAPVAAAPHLAALALRSGGPRELLLANLGMRPMVVELRDWAVGATCSVLDEAALRGGPAAGGPPAFAPRPAGSRVALGPYAVASCAEIGPGPEGVIA